MQTVIIFFVFFSALFGSSAFAQSADAASPLSDMKVLPLPTVGGGGFPNQGGELPQNVEITNLSPEEAEKVKNSPIQKTNDANRVGRFRPLKKAPSVFELFVHASTGQVVKPYGFELFDGRDFGPVNSAAVAGDYVLAPGDEILIYTWGGVDINYKAVVDRGGHIQIPRVGSFNIAGVRVADLETKLKSHVSRYFTNFNLTANVSRVHGVQVYVAGQAVNPGMYSLPGTSTLLSAIFEVAEPGVNGSYRQIHLKRDNKIIATLDLYNFILMGEKIHDIRLLSGDVIVVASAGPRVAVLGAVDKPAIYELKPEGENLDAVLQRAGVDRATTDLSRVLIERINPASPKAPRSVLDIVVRDFANTMTLVDADILTVKPVKPIFSNDVTLRGNVVYPVRYPYTFGMRVTDLIPDRSYLISADYYQRRIALVRAEEGTRLNEVRNLVDEINWDYAVVERLDPNQIKPLLLPFNLGKALSDPSGADNLKLQSGDVITIFSVKDLAVPKYKRSAFVKVAGEVKVPGVYSVEPGETLRDILRKAGGFTPEAYLFGSELRRESTRLEQEKRYDQMLAQLEQEMIRSSAVATGSALNAEDIQAKRGQLEAQKRLFERMRTTRPTGRIVLSMAEEASTLGDFPNISIEDKDVIEIPSRPVTVSVFGSVFGQGAFLFENGDTLNTALLRSGGATRFADVDSVFVIRASGEILSARQQGLNIFSSFLNKSVMPGDTLVVPENYERVSGLRFFKDIAFVFGQFGIGAAAIRSLTR